MLFKDRLEIWNPGTLPLGWSTDKLKKLHRSVPANPLIAESMYLAGFIERLGTGTMDIVRIAKKAGLKEPEFEDDDEFKIVIYRKAYLSEATPEATPEVERLIKVMDGEKGRLELQLLLSLKDEKYFRNNFKQKALDLGLVEMTIPEKPTSGNQKYRLTALGKKLKEKLEGH